MKRKDFFTFRGLFVLGILLSSLQAFAETRPQIECVIDKALYDEVRRGFPYQTVHRMEVPEGPFFRTHEDSGGQFLDYKLLDLEKATWKDHELEVTCSAPQIPTLGHDLLNGGIIPYKASLFICSLRITAANNTKVVQVQQGMNYLHMVYMDAANSYRVRCSDHSKNSAAMPIFVNTHP